MDNRLKAKLVNNPIINSESTITDNFKKDNRLKAKLVNN